MLHAPNSFDNRGGIAIQNSVVEKNKGTNKGCANKVLSLLEALWLLSHRPPNAGPRENRYDASPKHQIAKQSASNPTMWAGHEKHVLSATKSVTDNANKTADSQRTPLNDSSAVLGLKVVSLDQD